jgi:hypothetical protein
LEAGGDGEDLIHCKAGGLAEVINEDTVNICRVPNFAFLWAEAKGAFGRRGACLGWRLDGGCSVRLLEVVQDMLGVGDETSRTISQEAMVALVTGPLDAPRKGEDGAMEAFGVRDGIHGAATVGGFNHEDTFREGR